MKLVIERINSTVRVGWQSQCLSSSWSCLPSPHAHKRDCRQLRKRNVFSHSTQCPQLPTTAERKQTSSANVKLMQRYYHPF